MTREREQHPGTCDSHHVTKRKIKRREHATQTNQKQSRKKTITDFLLLFFSPRFRVLLIHFERKKKFFFFPNPFLFSVGNLPSSKRYNLAKDKQGNRNKTEHIRSWSQKKIGGGEKKNEAESAASLTSMNQSYIPEELVLNQSKVVDEFG